MLLLGRIPSLEFGDVLKDGLHRKGNASGRRTERIREALCSEEVQSCIIDLGEEEMRLHDLEFDDAYRSCHDTLPIEHCLLSLFHYYLIIHE